ncbi:unnamed protein product [Effrenium voratum]|uniref:Fucosyltransferase n=1 Tax=Effrenium voratum TaxID=2562239 RepID=A0AA36I497_9DINO|nr:unnamed protein product [Effrenium voratum]
MRCAGWRCFGVAARWVLSCRQSCTARPEPMAFTCPPYYEAQTCCLQHEMEQIWEKVEDMLQFVLRVMEDQGEDLKRAEDQEAAGFLEDDGSICSEYHAQLFSSRLRGFREARQATAKGVDILQGATMHMLCAACFQSSSQLKLEQVDNFTSSALLSLQDRMGAIFTEQVLADRSPDTQCSLGYVDALTAGISFPSWGRFSPAFVWQGSLLASFAGWMDRVLSLLMEVPGSLLFQRTLLQLLFFYAERPDSDAFQLLQGHSGAVLDYSSIEEEPEKLCPDAPRLFIFVRQAVPTDKLLQCYKDLQAVPAGVRWVLTNSSHVSAMSGEVKAKEQLIWRRFEARSLHGVARALCAAPAWVVELEAMDCKDAPHVSRLLTSPSEQDLRRSSWPQGVSPVTPSPPPSWSGLEEYVQAHAAFVQQSRSGAVPASRKALVYVCTAMSYCGGHGDRLNGMLGAFVVAMLAGRAFFIDSQRPVPLSLVLQPRVGGIDWRMHGSHAVLPAGFNFNDNLAAFESDPHVVLDSQEDVLRIVSNQRLSAAALRSHPRSARALGLTGPRLHMELFQLLFQPSPALSARLRARKLPEGRRIGLHFRAGDQMPQHWKDPPRHDLAQLEEFLNCAEDLERQQGWNATFLLFADTDKVREMPRVQELAAAGKLVLPEQTDGLVHLDRSPATLTVRGLLQTWADWWTLAFDVDALVLSHSGFGATALELGPLRPAVLGLGCVLADGSTG